MPGIAHLSATQKNDVFRAITWLGLDPADFTWKVVNSSLGGSDRESARLQHKAGHWFLFTLGVDKSTFESLPSMYRRGYQWNGGEHCIAFEPGDDTPSGRLFQISWDKAEVHLRYWLERVKAETTAPDLWATLRSEPTAATVFEASAEDDRPFTNQETKLLADGLHRFVAEVARQNVETQEQLQDLRERVDRVERGTPKVPRGYWRDVFTNALVSHFVSKGLDSETAKMVWRVAWSVLGGLLQRLLGDGGGGPTMLPPDIGAPV